MAVMSPRERWTDERLDDLNKRVDDGFARVEGDIRAGFEKAEANLGKTEKRLEKKIEDTKAYLDRKIEDLEKKVDDAVGRLERDNGALKRVIYGAAATVILSQIATSSVL